VQTLDQESGYLTGRKAHQIATANPEADSADPASNPTITAIVDCKNVDRGVAARPRVEQNLHSTEATR
jgi:hypothetical protein